MTAGPSDGEGEINGVGEPLFEDTDAESAFRDGASWMQKRGFPEAAPSEAVTPTSPDNNNLNVPLRAPMPRRNRIGDLFISQDTQNAEESVDPSSSATITQQDFTPRQRVNSSGSFFERLRQQSIQGFTRPFSSMRHRGPRSRSSVISAGSKDDPAWSSDSDSDDFAIEETASVNQFHPTSFNIPGDSPLEAGEPEADEFA